jgi:hypothetical protein
MKFSAGGAGRIGKVLPNQVDQLCFLQSVTFNDVETRWKVEASQGWFSDRLKTVLRLSFKSLGTKEGTQG